MLCSEYHTAERFEQQQVSSQAVDARYTGLWLYESAVLQQQRFTRLASHLHNGGVIQLEMEPTCSISSARAAERSRHAESLQHAETNKFRSLRTKTADS